MHVTGHLGERVACGIDENECWLNDGTIRLVYYTAHSMKQKGVEVRELRHGGAHLVQPFWAYVRSGQLVKPK